MKQRRILVTGAGRSGTGYMAKLLTRLGCMTGHEHVFSPKNINGAREIFWPPEIPGDSSWLAAPYIRLLPPGTLVLHQVREPVANVRSSLRIQFFSSESWYRAFAEARCPALREGSEAERSMRYWLEWNRMAEGAAAHAELVYFRYRLEDVDSALVQQICDLGRLSASTAVIDKVLEAVPRDYNTRGDREQDRAWRWSDLPECETRREVELLAASYGYAGETEAGTLAVQRHA